MTFDTNIVKIAILLIVGTVFLVRTLSKSESIIIKPTFVFSVILFSLIVLHYFIFGTNINTENNVQLLTGFSMIVFVFWSSNYFRTWTAISPIFKSLRIIAVIFVLINLPWAITGGGDSFVDGNFRGITPNANILGGYIALFSFPLLLNGADNSYGNKNRIFYIIFMIISIYLIYLTRSRGALLSVGAASVFTVMASDKIKYNFKGIFIVLIAILTVALLTQAGNKYADLGIFATRDPLLNQRFTAIAERPWTGWGFNSDVYSFYYQENAFPAMEKGNTLLQIFEEFGAILGIFIALGTFYIFLRAAIVLRSLSIGMGLAATLIGSLIHLMIETWLFNFQSILSIYVWVILLMYMQFDKDGLSSAR